MESQCRLERRELAGPLVDWYATERAAAFLLYNYASTCSFLILLFRFLCCSWLQLCLVYQPSDWLRWMFCINREIGCKDVIQNDLAWEVKQEAKLSLRQPTVLPHSTFGVTWRHRSRSIKRPFDTPYVISYCGPLERSLYLQLFSRHCALSVLGLRVWPFGVTWLIYWAWFYVCANTI